MLKAEGYRTGEILFENDICTILRGTGISDGSPVQIRVYKPGSPQWEDRTVLRNDFEITASLSYITGVMQYIKLIFRGQYPAVIFPDRGLPLNLQLRTQPSTLEELLKTAISIADTLRLIHENGIIHGNLTPFNIYLYDKTGSAAITGFSMATAREMKIPDATDIAAPGASRDYREDYHSLGVIFYEIFTGVLPFTGSSAMGYFIPPSTSQVKPPHEINKALPLVLSQIIMKLMSKNPGERCDDVKGIIVELQTILQSALENRHRTGQGISIWRDLTVTSGHDSRGRITHNYSIIEDDTLRRQVEKALIDSEEKYRNLFESAKDAIAIFNKERIIDCNQSLCDLFHITKEAIVRYDLSRLAPEFQPEEISSEKKLIQQIKLADKGIAGRFEWLFLRLDGEPFFAELNINPVEIDNDHCYQAIIRDISYRKEAEKALKDSETKLRALIENSSDIISILDRSGLHMYDSSPIERILGFRPEDIVGSQALDYIHPDDASRIRKHFKQLLKLPGQIRTIEFRHTHKNGSWHLMESTARNLLHDPLIGGVVLNTRDITERKRTEEVLKIYSNIVSSSQELMAFIDTSRIFLAANNAFLHAFNKKRRDVINRSIDAIFHDNEEIKNVFASNYENSLVGKAIHTIMWYDIPDGKRTFYDLSMHPFIDRNNIITGVVISLRDTTRELQQEMQILNVGEKERKKIGIELHDGLSHDLLGIAIRSRMLAERLQDRSMDESSDAMKIEEMINNAINTTRNIAQGVFPVNLEKTGFDGLFKKIKMDLEEQHGISCKVSMHGQLQIENQKIAIHLHHIIQEAVINIIKHSGATRVHLTLTNDDDDNVTLIIGDDGRGIRVDKESSTGMGLNIMYYRARLIGAQLTIDSSPGGGTEIICSFRL